MPSVSDLVNGRILIQIDDMPGNDNFRQLMVSMAQPFGDYIDVIEDILDSFDLDTAVGDQLDKIGEMLNLSRSGFADAEYRRNLRIQILIIKSKLRRDENGLLGNWNGTVNNILEIVRTFIGAAVLSPVILTNIPPYHFKIVIPGSLTELEVRELFQFIRRALYAGVLGYIIFLIGDDPYWALGEIPAYTVISVNEAETVFTDISSEFTNDTGVDDFEPFISEFAVDAYCAFGWVSPFTGIYFDHTGGTDGDPNLSIEWQYWNGATWDLLDIITDGTDNLHATTDDQFVSWNVPDDWATTTINGQGPFYYMRAYIDNLNVGNSPTYVYGFFGSSKIPDGVWDVGAVTDEGHWAFAIGSAIQVWQVDSAGPTYVDQTDEFNSSAINPMVPYANLGQQLGDYCVFGAIDTYGSMSFNVSTPGADGETEWEYWDGTTWQVIPGYIDNTVGFTVGGTNFVGWFPNPADWAPTSINGSDSLYFVRARLINSKYTINPEITQGYLNTNGVDPFGSSNAAEGKWIQGAVANEGTWSLVISTHNSGTTLGNDNT